MAKRKLLSSNKFCETKKKDNLNSDCNCCKQKRFERRIFLTGFQRGGDVTFEDNWSGIIDEKCSLFFFLFLPICRWILTLKISMIRFPHLNRALWEYQYQRTLSLACHSMSYQHRIVIQVKVVLSAIDYRVAEPFHHQTQISSHQIQFQQQCQAISSISIHERVT